MLTPGLKGGNVMLACSVKILLFYILYPEIDKTSLVSWSATNKIKHGSRPPPVAISQACISPKQTTCQREKIWEIFQSSSFDAEPKKRFKTILYTAHEVILTHACVCSAAWILQRVVSVIFLNVRG